MGRLVGTLSGCACDDFLRGFIPSAALGVRPASWRALSEDPEARLGQDLTCSRGDDLVLAFCTECRRRWSLSWDQQNDTYAAAPIEPEVLAMLNLQSSPEQVAAYLVTPTFRAWGHALGKHVDRYLLDARYDTSRALQLLEAAQRTPGLAPYVASSIGVRIERVKRRALEDRIAQKKR